MKFKEYSDFFYGRMVLFLNDEISIGIIRPEKMLITISGMRLRTNYSLCIMVQVK